MAENELRRRNFRQSNITNFFCRALGTPTEPRPKREKKADGILGSARHLLTDPWEDLEERHRLSVQLNGNQYGLPHLAAESSALFQKSHESMETQALSSSSSMNLEDDGALAQAPQVSVESPTPCPTDSSMTMDSETTEPGMVSAFKPRQSDFAPDWSGTSASELIRYLQPSDYILPELQPSSSHTVLVCLPLLEGKEPAPSAAQYVDAWDYNHVRLPCSGRLRRPLSHNGLQQTVTRWELITNNIIRSYQSITDLVPAISAYYTGIFNSTMITGLIKTVKDDCTPEEAHFFISVLLPFIASLVIELPSSCTQPIPLLKSGMNHMVTFSQRQIASILANAFFCTFPPQKSADGEVNADAGYPSINFDWLFSSPKAWRQTRSQCKSEKLKCLMNYFYKIKDENPSGLVSFARRSLEVFPNWAESQNFLSKAHITHKGIIEDQGVGCLQVDFANKFVGGGVLREGCVQEEIRFVVNPELIAARLFTESLQPNECLLVVGAERFNDYLGYGDTFKFKGSHSDVLPRDSWGRRMTQIVAIDAYKFGKTEEQYRPEFLLRELNKAFVGFHRGPDNISSGPLSAVATGNWGCGAFRGEPRLKFLLQLMACSETGRDMMYFTFSDTALQEELAAIYEFLISVNATVGDIFRILCRFNDEIIGKSQRKKRKSLYSFIHECFQGL